MYIRFGSNNNPHLGENYEPIKTVDLKRPNNFEVRRE